jgi:carbamoyl-phosphate synthase small subunit
MDLAKVVSTKKKYIWQGYKTWTKESGFKKNKKKIFKIVAIDYGIKKNILRYFSNFNCEVIVVPCDLNSNNILKLKPDGIFLSNGPGDPSATGKYAIKIIKNLIKSNLPIFGICLGHQILALALNAKTKKMKLGHRGANHPIKNLINDKVEITSQNHGFEIVKETLSKNIEITHKSLFDGCVEGIKIKNKPVFSVQYHPESNPGPQDSHYLFNQFIDEVKKYAKKKRH